MPLDGTFYRRLAITAAVLFGFRLGVHLPFPGLDAGYVAQLMGSPSVTPAPISIFAFGVGPFLSALLLIEGTKLLFPDLLRWELADASHKARLSRIGIGLALLFTLVQATGLAISLEDVPRLVTEPGLPFRVAAVMTLVAGTALVIALVEIIDRHGLGAGLWLLFLTPALVELPYLVKEIAFDHALGIYPTSAIVQAAAFSAVAMGAVAALVLASGGAAATATTCVWTPLIANSTVTSLLLGFAMLFTSDANAAAGVASPSHPAWYAATAIAVPVIVWLYTRAYACAGVSVPVPALITATMLGGALIAGAALEYGFRVELPLRGVQLIIAATAGTVMLMRWRSSGHGTKSHAESAIPEAQP
ncbi:MAG TPA: hypothetical protein VNR88_05695 [Hyphomicrobium sp.]|nr:hypothetical protein [Hyphomicrobium sp.]